MSAEATHAPTVATDAGWSTTSASGGPTAGGDAYRIEWHTPGRTRHVALFRVVSGRLCVLQHTRTVRVSQRVDERVCTLDSSPRLEDVPQRWRSKMDADGYTPTEAVTQ